MGKVVEQTLNQNSLGTFLTLKKDIKYGKWALEVYKRLKRHSNYMQYVDM